MSYKVIVNKTADLDIEEATGWYEVQRDGLGKLYLLSVSDIFRLLTINPLFMQKLI